MTPDLLSTYQVDGWLDLVVSLFAAVPAGFLLGCFLGLLSFGIFRLFSLVKSLI